MKVLGSAVLDRVQDQVKTFLWREGQGGQCHKFKFSFGELSKLHPDYKAKLLPVIKGFN